MPNQDQNSNANPSPIFPQADLPPLPPSFQDVPPAGDSNGSAAPSETTPPGTPPVISGAPKKKFGGGRIIATILGILLLVGGVGAGFVLTQQQQLFQQKAKVCECDKDNVCGSGYTCSNATCGNCIPNQPQPPQPPPPPPPPPPVSKCTEDTSQGCYDLPCTSTGLTGGTGSCPGGLQKYCCKNYPSTCADGGKPGDCVNPTYATSHNQSTQQRWTIENGVCALIGAPSCTGTGGTTTCKRLPTTANLNSSSITITQAMVTACTNSCPDGTLYANKYTCSGINLAGGCQDNGQSQSASVGNEIKVGALTCGTVQIDVGCKNSANTWGSVAFTTKNSSQACSTPTTPGPGPLAQCLNVKAYDSTWALLTSAQLSSLTPGTTINYCVAGTTSSGNFDKAKFTINGVAQAETTTKRPATEDYCQSYQIPTGVSSFNVSAQIHHATLGWSL